MALVTLMARLGLDTSGFSSGLKKAEGDAKRTSSNIGGAFTRAFGSGLGIGTAFAVSRFIGQQIRNLGQLKDNAEKFGIVLDREVIAQIDELTNRLGLMKVGFDSAMVKPISGAAKLVTLVTDGVQLLFHTMTKGAKEAERIMLDVATKREEMIFNRGGFGDPSAGLDGKEKLSNEEITDLLKVRRAMLGRITGSAMSGNISDLTRYQVGRVGAIDKLLGAQGVSPTSAREDSVLLNTMMKIEENTRKTVKEVENISLDFGGTFY